METIDVADILKDSPAEKVPDPFLPDPDLLIFYKLLGERRIMFDGEVDETTISFCQMITIWNMEDKGIPKEKRKPIWILLFNYGGDIDRMWSLIDAISTSVTPVYTVNLGTCYSAAAYIFMAGAMRFMMPNAHLMIHEGSASIAGDVNKVRNQIGLHEDFLNRVRAFILRKTSIPKATLTRKRDEDWFMCAEECMKYNICDRIIQSIDEIL